MKKKLLALSTAVVLAAPLANAVVLNPRGTGQVLLYPYYTVSGGNNTLLTIGNMSDRGKAVKVRFLEGHGLAVLDFNVYLSPYDVWTSAIFPIDNTNPASSSASLVTDDNSCTAPEIKTDTTLPALPDGRHYVPFSNSTYSDKPGYALFRTREGSIEVIEMSSIVPDSGVANAVAHSDQGIPSNCNYLTNAWMSGGFWQTDSTKDLSNPTGGLFGNAQIINVAAGTMLTYNATALEEFRQDPTDIPRGTKNSVVMHGVPGGVTPNLSNALTDPTKNLASASVIIDGKLIRADYPADKQAIDAVSAVLIADTLSNDFLVEPAIGAQSEWVVSFPTKRFYTDEAIIGHSVWSIAPFNRVGSGGPTNQYDKCENIADSVIGYNRNTYEFINREGIRESDGYLSLPLYPPFLLQLCYTTQVIPIHPYNSTPSKTSFLGTLLSSYVYNAIEGHSVLKPARTNSGRLTLDLGWVSMRPSHDGTVFHGLPAIGFLATNYVNSNVQDGVLANYSGTFPHRTTVKCTKNGNAC